MSCRLVSPGVENALRGISVVDRDKLQTGTVVADGDSNADVAHESVIVVSPQDMPHVFGPTLWRKGFFPIFHSDESQASPAPVESGSPAFSTTRSFSSTCMRRMARSGAAGVLQGASLPLFRRATLAVSAHGMQPCVITRLASVPRWFRSSFSSTRTPILRSAVVLGWNSCFYW